MYKARQLFLFAWGAPCSLVAIKNKLTRFE